jgi:poly(3-hydroxyalkanoate) synthetase
LRNSIALQFPQSQFLMSSCNEDRTEEDIIEMGERLAKEIKQHVIEFCPGSTMRRLSFVGFSMGGLICRAAFPLLECYSSKFYTFISLSSPHLGYMYNSSKLFDTGMWFLKKWKKSKSLAQLSMTDCTNVEESCLFRLSSAPGLAWFSNIMLVCSN